MASRSDRGETALYWPNDVILNSAAGTTSVYLEYFPETAALYAELQTAPTAKMLDRAKNPPTIDPLIQASDVNMLMTGTQDNIYRGFRGRSRH